MTIEDRKSAFYFIRDVPYKLRLSLEEQDCSCSTKARMLARILDSLGLQTRFILCKFNWLDTPIPKPILNLSHETIVTHMFLEVFIPETNKWVYCDPTWDIGLKKAGFSIEEWDGINPTGIAVKPLQIFSPDESLALIKGFEDVDRVEKSLALQNEFYTALNRFFAEQRLED
jgi:hypothetical protein